MALWLQGLFFENISGFGIKYRAESEGGVGVVVYDHLAQFMFRGSIWRDPEHDVLVGAMEDQYGTSVLSEIRHADSSLEFTKCYEKRSGLFQYSFKVRDGATLVGTWTSLPKHNYNGLCRCLVTELPDEFFTVESINHQLEKAGIEIPP